MRRQALEEERLGPRREPYSDDRSMRLAVQEGATALVCSLMPAIEPVVLARACSAGVQGLGALPIALHTRCFGIGSFVTASHLGVAECWLRGGMPVEQCATWCACAW